MARENMNGNNEQFAEKVVVAIVHKTVVFLIVCTALADK
jgi:hypothetical protein